MLFQTSKSFAHLWKTLFLFFIKSKRFLSLHRQPIQLSLPKPQKGIKEIISNPCDSGGLTSKKFMKQQECFVCTKKQQQKNSTLFTNY